MWRTRLFLVTCGLLALAGQSIVEAQIAVGTWVRKEPSATAGKMKMTMTVEPCCQGGRRLTYHIVIKDQTIVMNVDSRMDGSEAQVFVGGKASGQTMAIKRIDARHTSCIVKMNGKLFGTTQATLSADGKTLTSVNDFSSSSGGNPAGKSTETWVLQ
jgi:hypothetical protein